MATCPRCGGALGDHHHCPPGERVTRWIRHLLFAGIFGGGVGFLTFELLGSLTGAEPLSILGGAVGFLMGLVTIRGWRPWIRQHL